MDSTLYSLLNSKPDKNIAALGFFSNYQVEEYFIEGKSALIFGRSDHLWAHISSSSEIELSLLLSKYHTKTKYYYSVEDWMIPLIFEFGTPEWVMTTNRYILQENAVLRSPEADIVKIDKGYASFIHENSDYKAFTSIAYIEDRLTKDISAGIIENNMLAAWGFTHDDGALGFLHVLDKYRNRGYATEIMLALIQERKKTHKPVYGNIVPDNNASKNLVGKLGFKLDCKISWIKLHSTELEDQSLF
ncbi:MAG: GNAT family N-acetyltransferase [Bacteroidales bacterium]|nr:GNAT family N-acetyltransferase [Bacteroidales bacterium]